MYWGPLSFLCEELGGHTVIAGKQSLTVREPSVRQLEALDCTIQGVVLPKIG